MLAETSVPVGWHSWTTWAQRAAQRPRFLIDGLLHSGATVVTGRPEAGKTTLVAAMTAVIARGDQEFLGRPVRDQGLVMVASTDPSEADRWGQRMAGLGVPAGQVMISHSSPASLQGLAAVARDYRPKLFVLDNVLGSIVGDVRDNQEASRLLAQVSDLGCAIGLVHHSSQKQYEDHRAYATGPMGSTVYEAWARSIIHVSDTGHGGVKLSVKGNDAAPAELSLTVAFNEAGIASYALLQDRERPDARPRKQDTQADRVTFVEQQIVGNPALKNAGTHQALASTLGVSKAKVQRALKVRPATYRPGEGWAG